MEIILEGHPTKKALKEQKPQGLLHFDRVSNKKVRKGPGQGQGSHGQNMSPTFGHFFAGMFRISVKSSVRFFPRCKS